MKRIIKGQIVSVEELTKLTQLMIAKALLIVINIQ
jgi:hypothetical protein